MKQDIIINEPRDMFHHVIDAIAHLENQDSTRQNVALRRKLRLVSQYLNKLANAGDNIHPSWTE